LPDTTDTLRTTLVVLSVLLLVCLGRGLGSVALIDPDEGRNAAVGAEMAASGNWVVPHYNGLPYLDKPVLLFAAIGISTVVLGRSELAARLPALVFTLATAVLLILLGRQLYSTDTGALAAVVLLSCPLVLAFARIVIFDAVMMFWMTASLAGLYLALEEDSTTGAALAWAAAGAGVLTKGPVGLALPVLVGLAHCLVSGRSPRRARTGTGLLVFAAVVGPWFAAVVCAHPEFAHYAFVRETFERVATDRMERTAPFYTFIVLLLAGALPWIIVPLCAPARVAGWWRTRREETSRESYLLLWIFVPIAFFTLSQSKRLGYILPVFPAVALLTAHLSLSAPRAVRHAVSVTAAAALIIGLIGLGAGSWIAGLVDPSYETLPAIVAGAARRCGAGLLLVAALGLWARRSGHSAHAVAVLVAFIVVPALSGHPVLAAIAEQRSARELAAAIEAVDTESEAAVRVVAIARVPPSLPFYLGRAVLIATDDGTAIRSNYVQEYLDELRQQPGSTLRAGGWWREAAAACSEPTIFVTHRKNSDVVSELEGAMPPIAASGRYAAFGPCGR
jgi:4-amino-4-deoxy-L-arabinose transferase-like glycosyltransferase